MDSVIQFGKTLYYRNKAIFVIALILGIIFLVGCSTSGSSPPPSGPIGGGCG